MMQIGYNNSGVQQHLKYVFKKNYGVTYILTNNRLNPDALEKFFAIMRYKGGFSDHPLLNETDN